MPLESATVVPLETTTVVPLETTSTTVVPLETTTVVPLETTTEVPLETTTVVPLETTTEVPLETTTVVPLEIITVVPLETTTIAPLQTAVDMSLEATINVTKSVLNSAGNQYSEENRLPRDMSVVDGEAAFPVFSKDFNRPRNISHSDNMISSKDVPAFEDISVQNYSSSVIPNLASHHETNLTPVEIYPSKVAKPHELPSFQRIYIPPYRRLSQASLESHDSKVILESIREQSDEGFIGNDLDPSDDNITQSHGILQGTFNTESKKGSLARVFHDEDQNGFTYPDFDPTFYTRRFNFTDGIMNNETSRISNASSPEHFKHLRKGQSVGYEADVGTPSPISTPQSFHHFPEATSIIRTLSSESTTSSLITKPEPSQKMSAFRRQSAAFLNFFNITPNNQQSYQHRNKQKRRSTILKIADTIINSLTKDTKPVRGQAKQRGTRPRRKANKVTAGKVEVFKPSSECAVGGPKQRNEAIIHSLPMGLMHPPLLPMNHGWRNSGIPFFCLFAAIVTPSEM